MNTSFARSDMLPAQKPPVTERGLVKWLRENLFSGPFNTILTLLGLLILYYIVRGIGPWLLNSVWNANSLKTNRTSGLLLISFTTSGADNLQ